MRALNMLFQDKDFRYYTGAPCIHSDENLYPGITFLGAFCP
jgi:hypothetical protein